MSQSGEKIRNHCKTIVAVLKNAGYSVFPLNILDKIQNKNFVSQQTSEEKEKNRFNLIKSKNKADLIILETSFPSTGIG